MPYSDAEMHLAQWRESILTALRVSEQLSRELEPVALYVSAIFGFYESGRIPLALNSGDYCPESHFGFVKDGCWWLRHDDLHVAVCRHLSRLHQPMPLKAGDIRGRLANNGLIQTEMEIRNGVERMLHTNPALVYRFIDLGLLPALKLGSIRVRRDALEEFLRNYEGCDLSNPEDIKPLSQAG